CGKGRTKARAPALAFPMPKPWALGKIGRWLGPRRERDGERRRKIRNAQDLSTPAAVCGVELFPRLYRPHQCQLCGADDARRSEHVGLGLRLCTRHLLLGLLGLRAAEQFDHGEGRRTLVDRPHHDHLGDPRGITATVTGSTSFGIVRFLLGVAEAGFFPGLILYFTYWFPSYHHARIVSGFLTGLPIAVALGAPISTALLGLDGWLGLRGWQIMYIVEGLPTVLIGVVTLFVLTDRPEQARFLTAAEKTWLAGTL